MALLTVVALASVPAAGLLPSAIDAQGTAQNPARMTKRAGYNAVQFGFTGAGAGDYALYKYWPDSKSWKPEGPRGSTPAAIAQATVAGSVPPRISLEQNECEICIVLCAGTGIAGGLVEVEEQVR